MMDVQIGEGTVFSAGKLFTFLFVTLGPFKVIGPFARMTRGHGAAEKRKLAFQGTAVALVAVLAASTLGANVLQKWGISVAALQLTAGIVLFLVALRPVLHQYEVLVEGAAAAPAEPPAKANLVFSPLAFPTIITPYGIAVLIIAVSLRPDGMPLILGLTAFVLFLDLLAMLAADQILKTSVVASALSIIGAVLGVLQMALGIQAAVDAVRLLMA